MKLNLYSLKKIVLLTSLVFTINLTKAQTNVFPTTGNVGIGTTTPQSKLHILDTNTQSTHIIEGNHPYIYSGLRFVDAGQNTAGKVKEWAIWAGRDGGTWLSGLGFHRYDAVNRCQAGAICDVSMFLHDNGNVGIGTTNPTEKLEVNGNIKSFITSFGMTNINDSSKNYVNFTSNNHGSVIISSNLYVEGNNNFKIANTHGTLSGSAIIIPGNGQANQNGIVFYTNTPANVTSGNQYNGKISMLITNLGSVGIGTTTPDEMLTVKGKVHAQEVRVDLKGPLADFVFEKYYTGTSTLNENYKMPTLKEVEQFTKENHRLPNIPSAKEIEQNGLQLGEMNNILLQKIEELTLYIIEQQKNMDTQAKELKEIKNQLKIKN